MKGRWTIRTHEPAWLRPGGPPSYHRGAHVEGPDQYEPIEVVPCDDAAIARVMEVLGRCAGWRDEEQARWLAEQFFTAAAGEVDG